MATLRAKRRGRGRPRGARNKRTQELVAKAAATGLLPHELLLAMSRGEKTPGIPKPTREEIIAARVAAGPYYAARLSAMVAKVNDPTNPWEEIFKAVDGKSRGLPHAKRS